jgi:hypothetical protein
VFFGKYNDYRVLCYFHLSLLISRQCYSLKFETKVMMCKFWCNPMIVMGLYGVPLNNMCHERLKTENVDLLTCQVTDDNSYLVF